MEVSGVRAEAADMLRGGDVGGREDCLRLDLDGITGGSLGAEGALKSRILSASLLQQHRHAASSKRPTIVEADGTHMHACRAGMRR